MPNETNEKMDRPSGSLLESLTGVLSDAEKERQMLGALCVNYTAAYCCDLMADRMEVIKRKNFSHCAQEKGRMRDALSYSEWIRHAFETFVVKGTAPDYLEVFDAQNVMRHLQREESFVYRHRTLPNGAGMEYFEATVVRLYVDEKSFKVIVATARSTISSQRSGSGRENLKTRSQRCGTSTRRSARARGSSAMTSAAR